MIFRAATSADAAAISALIRSLVGPSLVNADGSGAEPFWQSIATEATAGNIENSRYSYLVAMSDSELAGVIAIRDLAHITALFVALPCQRQGMATRLWVMASTQARQRGNQGIYTVNSALAAMPVYQRFGFVAVGAACRENGIRFQPMVLRTRNKPEFIFVYGTLRKHAATLMSHLLAQHCEFHATGSMCGVLYEVAGYPGAVQSNDAADRVMGELYRVREHEELLEQLDAYEECGPQFPTPHEYIRKLLPIQLDDGSTVVAWVYVFNRPVEQLQKIVSGDYLQQS